MSLWRVFRHSWTKSERHSNVDFCVDFFGQTCGIEWPKSTKIDIYQLTAKQTVVIMEILCKSHPETVSDVIKKTIGNKHQKWLFFWKATRQSCGWARGPSQPKNCFFQNHDVCSKAPGTVGNGSRGSNFQFCMGPGRPLPDQNIPLERVNQPVWITVSLPLLLL